MYKVIVLVTKSCLTLWDPMDCSPPGSLCLWNSQARTLEWVAAPFFRESSWPRDQTLASCIAGRFFTVWEDVRRFYANTMPFYTRALSVRGFWYPLEFWTRSSLVTEEWWLHRGDGGICHSLSHFLKPVLGYFGLSHFWVYFWLQTTWSYLKIGGLFISIM